MCRPRLLLADDHAQTRALLCSLLEPEFDVVADVGDGDALVDAAERLSPDVIVTDISMPRLDGISAAVAMRRHNSSARIIFVTVHAEPLVAARALATGALGYVLKPSAGDELVPAVRAALRGERHISRDVECPGEQSAAAHASGAPQDPTTPSDRSIPGNRKTLERF